MCCYLLDVFRVTSISWQPFRATRLLWGEAQLLEMSFSTLGAPARSLSVWLKAQSSGLTRKKGFGFIIDPEVSSDIFVHFSVIQADGFKTLNEGETVEYELYQDEKGAKARNVVRV